jgi:hypothetical protein
LKDSSEGKGEGEGEEKGTKGKGENEREREGEGKGKRKEGRVYFSQNSWNKIIVLRISDIYPSNYKFMIN